jgi:hypothetical protein
MRLATAENISPNDRQKINVLIGLSTKNDEQAVLKMKPPPARGSTEESLSTLKRLLSYLSFQPIILCEFDFPSQKKWGCRSTLR